MEIKKVSIENYRSLKKIVIDEFNSTTIFYGNNNAGKSNILNCLQLIFQRKPKLSGDDLSDVESFYTGIIPNSSDNFYNHQIENPIKFNIEIEVNKNELTIDGSIAPVFTKDKPYTFIFEGRIEALEPIEFNRSEIIMEKVSVDKTDIYLYNNQAFQYFPVLGIDAKKQSESERAFIQLINVFNDCLYVIGSDRDMLEVNFNEDIKSDLTPKTFKKVLHNLYLSQKKHHYFEAIDDVFSKPPFNYGHISFSQERDKLEIMIKENDFRLPIKHLGSGVLQSLYIITAIVLSKSKIVCIEELEQNLSPKKQFEILKKVQSMIADPKLKINQLIITSHSSVYSKPKLGTIYFLKKDKGVTVIVSKVDNSIGAELQKHFEAAEYKPMTETEFEAFKKQIEDEHDLR